MNSNWSYSPETPNLGQIRWFLEPCDLEIWPKTLKNNRSPLPSNIKLYASFHHHTWIQTGVTVRKRLSWVVTLTFDLWPWPFAWTLLWSLVITSWWDDDGNIHSVESRGWISQYGRPPVGYMVLRVQVKFAHSLLKCGWLWVGHNLCLLWDYLCLLCP